MQIAEEERWDRDKIEKLALILGLPSLWNAANRTTAPEVIGSLCQQLKSQGVKQEFVNIILDEAQLFLGEVLEQGNLLLTWKDADQPLKANLSVWLTKGCLHVLCSTLQSAGFTNAQEWWRFLILGLWKQLANPAQKLGKVRGKKKSAWRGPVLQNTRRYLL